MHFLANYKDFQLKYYQLKLDSKTKEKYLKMSEIEKNFSTN